MSDGFPDHPENSDGDSVYITENGYTIFRRESRPNYDVRHPGESQEGRLSDPNYTVRHPAESQNEQPFSPSDILGDEFVEGLKGDSAGGVSRPWFREEYGGADYEQVRENVDDALPDINVPDPNPLNGDTDVWVLLILVVVALYLLRPVLEAGANVTE
jgi:hypothetical protein